MAAEIRPGTVDERELTVIATALARSGQSFRLVDADGSPIELPGELMVMLRAVVEPQPEPQPVSAASSNGRHRPDEYYDEPF